MFANLSPSLVLSLALALALVLGVAVKFWLASRQIRHVARHRQQVPAPFAHTVSLTTHQKAADYTITKTRLSLLELALGAALLLGWTLLGGLNLLNQVLLEWIGLGMTQQLCLLAAFTLISGLLELPLSLYQTFVIEEKFGFNKMSLKLWLTDVLKSGLLAALIGLPIAALVLWLMASAGNSWWFLAWTVWMGFNLLLLLIYPSFIAPWFNKFQPLQDAALNIRVTALMERCGFSAKGLFVMDGSKRSAHGNAYFTGFGASKRVVFYDTLLAKLSADQVDAVLAHELGHFKHKHIVKRLVSLFALSLAGFVLLGWLASQVWFYAGLGVQPSLVADALTPAPNDALALLLFVLVSPVLSFFLTPLMAHFSRHHEFQADAYAAEKTSGKDLASALLRMYEDNASTLTPDPVFAMFYYSHPPACERLARLGI